MSQPAPFFVDRAKGGRASCKGCKGNCPGGELRIAKVVPSPYGENQSMKSWHHVDCFLNALLKQRPATKRIDSIDDIGNWENISKDDQEFLLKKINEMEKLYAEKNSGKYIAKVIKNEFSAPQSSDSNNLQTVSKSNDVIIDDNMFTTFIDLCHRIARVDAYTSKTAIVNKFFTKGVNGDHFKGNLALWCKLLLPQVTKRVYNLKSKQLVKVFSKIFNTDHDDMLTHLEQGDVADTIQHFFSKSRTNIQPKTESNFSVQQIDEFLEELSKLTKEEEQIYHFKKLVRKCTLDDIKMLIRLIKGDLRINAGPKHILEGVHPDAYSVFQTSRDLQMVLDRVLSQNSGVKHKDAIQKGITAKLFLMTPVLPMLAEACKSVEMAMKKCPNGMFSEIKYDGERVQVHKKGSEFKYFSRALKPVMAHKVNHFKEYLPQAFPKGVDLILDAEVLLIDVNTGKLLPFGTLGIHKQSKFKDASVCLFVFDCLYYNGEVLMDMPIRKRRKILHDNMVEVKNHVMFSEMELIEKPTDLAKMIAKVLELGLEGLVLKDVESTYEPGKRHWLKVKKDYLFDGAMADTADLVVLGAWFGTGKKGGMMSVFLMGCLDKKRNKWVTVTKVHTGHDDNTLKRLQDELEPLMLKISQDYHKVPAWLDCNKGMVPDFVALDPKKMPVWEITGTELSKANLHTADGISVRFPRVTRIRDDKDWESATNLDELRHLYKTSKERTDVSLLNKLAETSESDASTSKKIKASPSKLKTIDTLFKNKKSKPKNDESDRESNVSSKNSSFEECVSEVNSGKTFKKKKKYDNDTTSTSTFNTIEDIDMKEESNDDSLNGKDISTKKRKRKYSEDDYNGKTIDMTDSSVTEECRSVDTSNSKESKKYKKLKINYTESETKYNDNIIDTGGGNTNNESLLSDDTDTKVSKNAKKVKKRNSDPSETVDDCLNGKDIERSNGPNLKTRDSKKIKIKRLPENPLPDVFKDKRIGFYPDFISVPENERRYIERHWIAYGGIVNKSLKSIDIDYLIHCKKVIAFDEMQKLLRKLSNHVKHVTKDWLVKCINDVILCDTTKFSVTVKP